MRFAPLVLAAVLFAPGRAPAERLQVLVDGRPIAPPVGSTEALQTGQDLVAGKEIRAFGRRYRHYQRQVGGIPVLGCGVHTTLDADGTPLAVDTQSCDAERTASFTIGGEQAASVATETIRSRGQPERLVASTPAASYYRRTSDRVLAPVWSVDVATANPWGVWRVFVSGEDASVLRVTELALHARGLVFPSGKSVDDEQPAMRGLPGLGRSTELTGPRVMVYDLTDALALCPTDQLFCVPAKVRTCSARPHHGVFAYSPDNRDTFGSCTAEDRFDQVTAYYQLARMAMYFTDEVGWTPGQNQLGGSLPLPALANIPLYPNAFFAPPSDGWPAFLGFGDEFDPPQVFDFTRDPSVPRHEFTHAMIYDSGSALNDIFTCVNDCPYYAGAMHEGLADYFAVGSLKARETVIGSRLGEAFGDGVARNLVNDFRFPCDVTGEVHDDGRIWGALMLEARRLLGPRTDALVFQSILDLPHRPDLQFAHALDAFVRQLPDLSDKLNVRLVEAVVRRGLSGPWGYERGDADLSIDAADDPWTCLAGNSCGLDTDVKEGDASVRVSVSSGAGGLAAYHTLSAPVDVRGKSFVGAWVKPSVDVGAGALQLVLDADPDCGSPIRTLPLPALTAGAWREVFPRLFDGEDLANVACVGLVAANPGASLDVTLDDVRAVGPFRFGPSVLTLRPGNRVTLRNRFPAPSGDAHFYHFVPPAGATRVSVSAITAGMTRIPTDLNYCGNVTLSGEGKVEPELNNAFLWAYDPDQFAIPASLTPLPIDQHLFVTGIPAAGRTVRRLRRFQLPPSPTGVYAVSVQGSGKYRVKLEFE